MHRPVVVALATLAVSLSGLTAGAPTALAARPDANVIWGPMSIGGKSEFAVYHNLGVGIFQTDLNWADVASTRPADPRNPNDPAYHWPPDISYAIQHAARFHIRVLLMVWETPPWANGGLAWNYPPTDPSALGDFLTAASRHYPSVHLWMIWGEPSRQPNFAILTPAPPDATQLTPAQAQAPHVYAQMSTPATARSAG